MRLSFYARYFQVEGGTSPSFGRPLCPTAIQPHNETGNGSGTANEDSTTEFGQPNAASSPNGSGYHNNYNLNGSSGLAGNGSGNGNGNGSSNINGGGYSMNSLPRNGAHLGHLQAGEGMDVLDDRPRMGIGSAITDHSRRSSISESSAISGFSSASNKTYVHEASTLVLETIENGVKRHFIVPLAIAQRPRWRRKGTKLHIYNDHTFIAKHLSGSGLQCSICMKSIPRRPGKQGYECRDCQLICHKQCHIRAPQACPNPTVLSMELNSYPVLTERDLNLVI
ncbi:GL20970 [Drosophila persimilis]|uniref:GL20970 n=1 Tax=Drosophila persimilis TaxID=7234 RepID=B4IR20_DROPE|nr:GL20970 [Drosophila persimilis]